MKKIGYILSLSIIYTLNSCVAPQYVTNITSHGKLENIKKKTATVVGLDRILIRNYEKTFHKNYKNSVEFAKKFSEDFANSLIKHKIFSKVLVDSNTDWKAISSMTSKKNFLKVSALFETCKTDYLITLNEFELQKKIVETAVNTPSTESFTNNYSEYLILKTRVEIYDVSTHDLLMEFDVFGEDQILFFSYSKSLKNAKNQLDESIVGYLKSFR